MYSVEEHPPAAIPICLVGKLGLLCNGNLMTVPTKLPQVFLVIRNGFQMFRDFGRYKGESNSFPLPFVCFVSYPFRLIMLVRVVGQRRKRYRGLEDFTLLFVSSSSVCLISSSEFLITATHSKYDEYDRPSCDFNFSCRCGSFHPGPPGSSRRVCNSPNSHIS